MRQRDTTVSVSVQSIIALEEGPKQLTEDLGAVIQIDDGPEPEDRVLVIRMRSRWGTD